MKKIAIVGGLLFLATFASGCRNRRYPMTVSLALSADHLVLATKDKGVWTAGANAHGALGTGSLTTKDEPKPERVQDAPDGVLEVHAYRDASCLRTAADIWCVGGSRAFGQGHFAPVAALRLPGESSTPALQIATTYAVGREDVRVCALLPSAHVVCTDLGEGNRETLNTGRIAALSGGGFGLFLVGEDGHVFRSVGAEVVAVPGLSQIMSVGVGDAHACAVDASGAVFCWGSGASGRLGDGTTQDHETPVAVKNLGGVVSVHPGADFTCAQLRDETVGCWGNNDLHQLADGTTKASLVAKPLYGTMQVVGLFVGGRGGCAAQKDGGARCWGANTSGRFGDKTFQDHSVPMPIKVL